MCSSTPVITFDGPSGAGKGTLSQRLAYHLNWHLLDSGAIYRIAAIEILHGNIDLDDTVTLKARLSKLKTDYQVRPDKSMRYFLYGRDITDALRSEECSKVASRIAAIPVVREALFSLQRSFLRPPGLVADGRDMATVVFPNAILKFYITASDTERAMRRYNQLKLQGINVTLSQVRAELKARDARDTKRQISPLCIAKDAIKIDTTSHAIDESFEKIMTYVSKVIDRSLE